MEKDTKRKGAIKKKGGITNEQEVFECVNTHDGTFVFDFFEHKCLDHDNWQHCRLCDG